VRRSGESRPGAVGATEQFLYLFQGYPPPADFEQCSCDVADHVLKKTISLDRQQQPGAAETKLATMDLPHRAAGVNWLLGLSLRRCERCKVMFSGRT
jgi:hypothetical protein